MAPNPLNPGGFRPHPSEPRKEPSRFKLTSAWLSELAKRPDASQTSVHLHVGPANSGKTYDSIETLKKSGSGLYLAPLRLLAWEIADKLNAQGFPCSLVTGEEKVILPNARFVSSTVEMFNPEFLGECIVLDEAQMLADEQRGWAWMRAIALARVPKLEIVASPDAEKLIASLSRKIGHHFRVTRHERLQPLGIAQRPWRVEQPAPGTVFVVFSRAGVLSLKTFLERRGYSVAAIYGNLPPEVKRKQAERFLSGDAQLCVATDAIGMGMNLPAARVCFTTMSKYDGKEQRILLPSEARQIAGRAGRYGLKENGEAGALNHDDLKTLQRLLRIEPPDLEFARITPELADLEQMRGPLAKRLEEWEKRLTIPPELKDLLLPANLEQQKMLAGFLRPEEVDRVGLEVVFTLIKAPASRDSIHYWYACVRALAEDKPIPVPHSLQQLERGNKDALLGAEQAVEQCDVYLWISNREGLKHYAPEKEKVQEYKWSLVERIDQVLALRQDMRQKCRKCGKILPLLFSYSVCEACFKHGQRRHFSQPRHRPFRFRGR